MAKNKRICQWCQKNELPEEEWKHRCDECVKVMK